MSPVSPPNHRALLPWLLGLALAACGRASPEGPAATSSAVPTATTSARAVPALPEAGAGEAASEPTSSPSTAPPQLPAWPPSSRLTRERDGKPFLVGWLKVDTTLEGEHVVDSRAAYVELADGKLEGVVSDQRGMARKVEGSLGADGSFELRQAGTSSPMVRGSAQGDEVKGELLVSVWGEKLGYTPQWRRLPFVVERGPFAQSLAGPLNGMVGADPIRWRLAASGSGLSGEARYPRGEGSTLTGRFDAASARLVVDESRDGKPLGQASLVAFTPSSAYGVWRSADGVRSGFVALGARWAIGEPLVLTPTLRLEPRYVLYFGRSCVFDHTWPALVGAGSHVARLNQELGAWSRQELQAPTCNEEGVGPSSERPYYEHAVYAAHPVGEGRFGLEVSHWADAGGAHGLGSKRCLLVDPAAGRIVEPGKLVAESGRAALTALVTKKLLAQNKVKTMAKLRAANGGSEEGPTEALVSADTDICVTEQGVDVSFEVYEIGPYSMNAPLVSLTRTEARPFFQPDETMAAALR